MARGAVALVRRENLSRLSLARGRGSATHRHARRSFCRVLRKSLKHAVQNAAGETRTPMLLPAADFASHHGFRRPQAHTIVAPEVWGLDFLFTLSPTSTRGLLGERRQVSTPSPSPPQSAQQGLARDWHRSGKGRDCPLFERKAFPVFDACSPHGFPCGDPLFFLYPIPSRGEREGAGEKYESAASTDSATAAAARRSLAHRRCNGNNYRRC